MKKRQQSAQSQKGLPNLLSSILLLVYGFVTVVTPNMRTFDSNGPKFFTLALLNLLVFVFFFFISSERKNKQQLFRFFNSNVGFAYGVMIFIALLSFFKAWNINESILHFAKIFTTFTAAWLVCLLVLRDKKAILPLAIGMSLMLILDSIHTFKGVQEFIILGKAGIGAVKSSYSNKNILTSAIFIKLPFAFWLLYFQKSWIKYIGAFSLFMGLTATFFLSARAFYLGIIAISLLLLTYAIIRHRQTGEKSYFKKFGSYILLLGLSFGVFAFVQQTMYPEKLQNATSVGARLNTITQKNNNSNNLRLTAWGQSLQMIKKEPILGVGIGNWKIRVLEYENSYSPSYTYMYKNHNDFLETTAEYGIIGGLAFIAVFIFIFWYFAKILFFKRDESMQHWFFLPALGLVGYAFDAFFNFPQDRPEIQSLFAIYVGISAALGLLQWGGHSPLRKVNFKGKTTILVILSVIVGLTLIGTTYMLNENIKSLKLQRIIKEEINRGKLKSPSERFLKGFPPIPDITILEEPIAVQKARFLMNEKKYEQARQILRKDKSNPYDARKEYFMAMTFYNEKNYDSTLVYINKALELKPYFYNSNTIAASIYEKRKEYDKSIALWRNFLRGVKNKSQAWTVPASLLERQNKLKEAEQLIDSAYIYLPKDKKVLSVRARIKGKMVTGPHMHLYTEAYQLYAAKKYTESIPLFTKFIEKVPEFAKAYELRAICYYYLHKYEKVIADIDKEEQIVGSLTSNIINIRGASYYNLGNSEKAKENFKKAMEMGDKDGTNNYNRFFKKKDKSISFQIPTKK